MLELGAIKPAITFRQTPVIRTCTAYGMFSQGAIMEIRQLATSGMKAFVKELVCFALVHMLQV